MKDKEKQITKSCKNCVCNAVCDKKLNLRYYFDNHDCEHYQPKLLKDSVVISKERFDALETIEKYHIKSCGKDSVVLTQEELEEKYEPSETFMAVARELEELKESLKDSVVLSKEEYEKLKNESIDKLFADDAFFKEELKANEDYLRKRANRDYIKLVKKQSSKETAEKFVDLVTDNGERQTLPIEDNKGKVVDKAYIVPQSHLKKCAKQLGVKIKE